MPLELRDVEDIEPSDAVRPGAAAAAPHGDDASRLLPAEEVEEGAPLLRGGEEKEEGGVSAARLAQRWAEISGGTDLALAVGSTPAPLEALGDARQERVLRRVELRDAGADRAVRGPGRKAPKRWRLRSGRGAQKDGAGHHSRNITVTA